MDLNSKLTQAGAHLVAVVALYLGAFPFVWAGLAVVALVHAALTLKTIVGLVGAGSAKGQVFLLSRADQALLNYQKLGEIGFLNGKISYQHDFLLCSKPFYSSLFLTPPFEHICPRPSFTLDRIRS